MNRFFASDEGQCLAEYALGVAVVAVTVLSGLLLFGPWLDSRFGEVAGDLQKADMAPVQAKEGDLILSVSAGRTRLGYGDEVVVLVMVSESSTLSATDLATGRSISFTCRRTCRGTLTGLGDGPGTIMVSSGWDSERARYLARLP